MFEIPLLQNGISIQEVVSLLRISLFIIALRLLIKNEKKDQSADKRQRKPFDFD